jgi:hypothetical protein
VIVAVPTMVAVSAVSRGTKRGIALSSIVPLETNLSRLLPSRRIVVEAAESDLRPTAQNCFASRGRRTSSASLFIPGN